MRTPAVRVTSTVSALPLPAARLARLATAALRRMTSWPVAVGLVVLDDRAIRRLNRRHLGHDYATDVISFNLQPGTGRREPETGNGEPGTPFGEVYVSADTAAREAKARGIDPAEELLRYAIHGMLHLFGHDDHRPADRRRMWARQEALVRAVQNTGTRRTRGRHGGAG